MLFITLLKYVIYIKAALIVPIKVIFNNLKGDKYETSKYCVK